MLRKVVVAALATGCYVQTADAFAAGGMAPLARATPAFCTTSAARPRRAGLCTVNMGELRRARAAFEPQLQVEVVSEAEVKLRSPDAAAQYHSG